jgi:hypothetical protein
MAEKNLRSYEGDVEMARAKLKASLAELRSPETISAFTDDLKKEAFNAKDALVEQAKSAAQSKVTELMDELKARAAANPAGVLAIGAGLAWHFLRHPPVTSALVGLGIFSLWQTNAPRRPGQYQPDYLAIGKRRLKEQANEALSKAKDIAHQGQDAVSAKAAELTRSASGRVGEWTGQIREAVGEFGSSKTDAPSITPSGDEGVTLGHNVPGRGTETLFGDGASASMADQESRDKVLLGVASVAVAAALGIACQKRFADADAAVVDGRYRV